MRAVVLALIALAFSGCVGGEEAEQPDLIGICPYWEQGESTELIVNGTATFAPAKEMNGYALDRYWVTPSQWTGQMRAFDEAGQRGINTPDGLVPVVYDVQNVTYQVGMSAPEHDAPTNPSNLTLEGEGIVTVVALYRVCGL